MYCAVSGNPKFNELIIVVSLSAIILSIHIFDKLSFFIFFLCESIAVELFEVVFFIVFIKKNVFCINYIFYSIII